VSTVSYDNMPAMHAPSRGSLVVYGDGVRHDGHDRYRIAEVNGPVVVDPITGSTWLGVRLPERSNAYCLIDFASVVNVVP
jgi:hypothetical protein